MEVLLLFARYRDDGDSCVVETIVFVVCNGE